MRSTCSEILVEIKERKESNKKGIDFIMGVKVDMEDAVEVRAGYHQRRQILLSTIIIILIV